MIQLLRKLRRALVSENRWSKYILYASGEIALVVIGILIALQINNWNEERKELKLEAGFIELLAEDLQSDAESLGELVNSSDSTVISKNLILDYQDGLVPRPKAFSRHFLNAVFHGIATFVPQNGAFREIQNAGGLNIIRNVQVRNQILMLYNEYDRFDKNVGQNYVENRKATRELVFQRSNGNLFDRDLNADDEVLMRLCQDSEIRDRLINNWAITYNRDIKDILQKNVETLILCKAYLKQISQE